jgi:RND family efflux transporter MFP subunit
MSEMPIDGAKTGINTTRSNLMSFNQSSGSLSVTIESRRPQLKPPRPQRHAGRFVVFLALVILVVATGLLIIGLLPRFHDEVERRQTADAIRLAAKKVQVVRPKEAPPEFEFSLPGAAEALTQATLYARINGYLKQRLVDIGDHVEAGQLLAVIDAPDIDTQLNQAIAELARSRAALAIAGLNYDREKHLLQTRVVSQQEYDQNEDIFNEATANVKANEANVQNLMAQQGFERITAPFTGTITARFVDVGALLAVGNSTTTSPTLFTISKTDILRVFAYVPQTYVSSVQPRQNVEVLAPEYPQRVFKGKVTRVADALDPSSGTERVEVQLPSEGGALKAGMYLTLRFHVRTAEPVLIAPASTLDIGRDGTRVATLLADHRIAFKTITIGRDFGTTVEITAGLTSDDLLVDNPSMELVEGAKVAAEGMEGNSQPSHKRISLETKKSGGNGS